MGVTYEIQGEVLTMALSGTYQPGDVMERFLVAMSDPACPTPVAMLIDVSTSDVLATRPSADIKMVAEFLGPYAARIGGRCAVVASRDVHFGLSQMGSVHSEKVGVTSRVFRSREEALSWLKDSQVARG